MTTVDAHVHLWDPGLLRYPWLAGTALERLVAAADLAAAAGTSGEFVVVQGDCVASDGLAEVRWLAEQARLLPAIRGIVAFAPLESKATGPTLPELRATGGVVGVRRLLQDEPPETFRRPGLLAGVRTLGTLGLPFDACVREHQLRDLTGLVRCAPDTVFVLDHLGKPRVGEPGGSWRHDLVQLARAPNVVCKLSGLGTETGGREPTAELLRPYLRHALDVFGPDRCLFGSDWPVMTRAFSYQAWSDLVRGVLADYGPAATETVFGATARRVYALPDRQSLS